MPENPQDLRTHALERVREAQTLADAAERAGRSFTAVEKLTVKTALDDARNLKSRADGLDGDAKLREAVENVGLGIRPGGAASTGGTFAKGRSGGPWATEFASEMNRRGQKTLTPSGAITLPSFPSAFVLIPDRPRSILELVPVQNIDPATNMYAYLKETVHDPDAATVQPGYKKPVSTYSVELVQERVRVIATLSEPVDRMLLADVALMSQFIGSVLFSAVELELENQLIAGDGSTTGGLDNMTGVLHVDGTQVQEWDTDVLTTTRKAVTALEKLNLPDESGFAWAMSPDAWESFELLKDTSRFLLGDASGQPPERLPVDRSRRRLWGLPVVPTTGVTDDGIAILGDWSGSIGMWSRQAAQLEWSEAVQVPDPGSSSGATWSAFETNQRVFRAELRAGMGVLRPAAFIITDVINDGSGA